MIFDLSSILLSSTYAIATINWCVLQIC